MYKEVVQNENGELIAWYPVVDHDWNIEFDFDVLNEYAIYSFESTGAYIAEHQPTGYALWSYNTIPEACEAIKDKINKYEQMNTNIEIQKEKFQEIVKMNSLNERYKDFPTWVKKKKEKPLMPYLARLRQRTEEIHAEVEKKKMHRNRMLGNQEYVYALINH